MSKTIRIDPVTRIEGHLAVRVSIDNNRVVDAYSSGEMFRGFEIILKGRDPMDAQQITQRICGVCPVSHGIASITAQDRAYGITPPENGRILRNLILGANYIQSHILHFYHLAALDFVDIAAILKYRGSAPALTGLKSWVQTQLASKALYPAAPFLPRYSGDYIEDAELNILAIAHYLEALDMRRLAHKLGATFGGKLPHAASLVPGGVTDTVTADKIASCRSYIQRLQTFIQQAYLPDVAAVAAAFPQYFEVGQGCKNFLSYGVFPEPGGNVFPAGTIINGEVRDFDPANLTEDIKYSLYASPGGKHPTESETIPDPEKEGAYSWLKAPRYKNTVMEVGPLARILVAYLGGKTPQVNSLVDGLLSNLGRTPRDLYSVLGRHAARAVECKLVADKCMEWLNRLRPGKPTCEDFAIPENAWGAGLTEAPRGALGHWINIRGRKIARYQCVVPTTWNCSPRDDRGNPGPVETALINVSVNDAQNPVEVARVVRSFDPCIACAVH